MSRYEVKRDVIECDECHRVDVSESNRHKHIVLCKDAGWWLPSGQAYKRMMNNKRKPKNYCDLCLDCKKKYIDKLRDDLGIEK